MIWWQNQNSLEFCRDSSLYLSLQNCYCKMYAFYSLVAINNISASHNVQWDEALKFCDHLLQFTILEKFLGTRNIIEKYHITHITHRDFKHTETSKTSMKLNLYVISRASTGYMQSKIMMQTWVLRSSSVFLTNALINTPH